MDNTITNESNENFGETIKIFQPKLLRIQNKNDFKNNLFSKTQPIKNKEKILQVKQKKNKEKKDVNESMKSFYQNPFQFMDYLIEKYFKNNTENNMNFNNTEVLQKIFKEMESLGNKSKLEVSKLIEMQIKKLQNKEECEKCESFKETKYFSKEKEPEEIESEPIDQNELTSILNQNFNHKFTSIINTKTDIKNSILNDKFSSLNKDSLIRKTLDCLKGEKIEIPKNNFIKVNDININDINLNEMRYTKNLLNIQRQFDLIKENSENIIIDNIEKTSKKEVEIFNNLIEKSQQSLYKMEEGCKISEEMIQHLKMKLNQEFDKDLIKLGIRQLNIHDENLENIKNDLNNNDMIKKEQNIVNHLERIKLIEENNRKAEEEIKSLFKREGIETEENSEERINTDLSERTIENLYKKFNKKVKNNKNKSFSNFSNLSNLNNLNFKNAKKKVIRPTITNLVNFKY